MTKKEQYYDDLDYVLECLGDNEDFFVYDIDPCYRICKKLVKEGLIYLERVSPSTNNKKIMVYKLQL